MNRGEPWRIDGEHRVSIGIALERERDEPKELMLENSLLFY